MGVWSNVIICAVLLVFCIFAVRSYFKKIKYRCCGTASGAVKRVRLVDKKRSNYPYSYRIKIEGMHCKNCTMRIKNEFHEMEGYYAVVSLKQNDAVVHTKQLVKEDELKQIVTKAGYHVVNVEPMLV